jgi:toxoflavin synthase
MQDIVGPIRQKPYIQGAGPSLSQPREQLPEMLYYNMKNSCESGKLVEVKAYQQTDEKPDKLYSHLPTVLEIVGDLRGQTVLDFGCGSGFYTRECVKIGAGRVIGIDNSPEQLDIARMRPDPCLVYKQQDFIIGELPQEIDIIVAPYVVNYPQDTEQLDRFFWNVHRSLKSGGKLVAIIDLPEGKPFQRYGTVHRIIGKPVDGARIEIELYNNNKFLTGFPATYFKPDTLEKALQSTRFRDIQWHKPIVSEEGYRKLGRGFWDDYLKAPEMGYLSAHKI